MIAKAFPYLVPGAAGWVGAVNPQHRGSVFLAMFRRSPKIGAATRSGWSLSAVILRQLLGSG